MSKARMAALAAVAAFALLLVGGAGPAAAQGTTKLAKTVKMTGKAKNGKKFTGTYTIQRFATKAGKVYAVGKVTGRLKGRNVTKRNVFAPVSIARQGAQAAQVPPAPIPPSPNACQILRLDIGAIFLDLLGLRVRTLPINALIEGVRGPGNLLGNLLCGITGILDPQAAAPATPSVLTQVLNALLALLPRTA
jgi:hypothetical protein